MKNLRISDLVARNALHRPDSPALIESGGQVTWRELDRNSTRYASGLGALGFEPGDRVATILRNGPAAVESFFVLAKLGLVGIPINYNLTPAEIHTLLADSRPRGIIVDAEFLDQLAPVLAETTATVAVRKPVSPLAAGWLDYDDVAARGSDYIDTRSIDPDSIRTIRYTSGTTAAPKGCLGTHGQILSSIENFLAQIHIPPRPYLQMLPLFSGAGIWMALAAAYQGVANVLLPGFSSTKALEAIATHGVGHACGVPTMLSRICDEYDPCRHDLSSFEVFGYTGAKMPPALLQRALDKLPCAFYQGFGGGELGGLVSFLTPEDHDCALRFPALRHRLSSVGRPAQYAEICLRQLAEDGSAGSDDAGEIIVRSPSNFSGYWQRPDETSHALQGEWVHTGDVGRFDADGYLYVIDRVKDMVVSGGMNVSSAEVEAVLSEHPRVHSVAVIGLPDDEWGEVVTAVVKLLPGDPVPEAELLAYARSRLAGYKAPKQIRFVDDFPLNSAGKVLKRELRRRYCAPASSRQADAPAAPLSQGDTSMQWQPDPSAGPQGYIVQPETFQFLDISLPQEGIAQITLNRPDKLNAFNSAMIGEIRAALWKMNFDDRVRVIVVTGAGRGFSAGRDVKELQGERAMPLPQYRAYVRANHDMLNDLEQIEKPIIAAINGVCAGGGVELAASCDFRFASETATFLLPEIFIGVIPASGACSRMIQMIGIENVKDLVMTGRTVDAREIREMGFVRRVVSPDSLLEDVYAFARQLMRGAPLAVGIGKQVTNTCQNVDTETGRILERLAQSSLVGSLDSTEGIKAFLDKRAPGFNGQ
ncbi:Long-chain-fatty-acid--CoA ligase FadD13 [Pigmentiphaga humi]|uniref:Long-chain-fatty-acid--CoA ligase FadD13 n=1 Tax=Pigmentiphaga humi TaxID=2478468 RepID=A0A3P4B5P6_9BURK|nr:AMP-binding protein [Pigmentiphaga humi]VCU70856.1 Long-chain-fatty-acid--CoA ligase FadD13 [Pigmentiphaga humi]